MISKCRVFCESNIVWTFQLMVQQILIHLQPNFNNLKVDLVNRCYALNILFGIMMPSNFDTKEAEKSFFFCFISLERVFIKENNANSSKALKLTFTFLVCRLLHVCLPTCSFSSLILHKNIMEGKLQIIISTIDE